MGDAAHRKRRLLWRGRLLLGTLPSPARSYSLSPHALEMPYAVYDLEITADGFYTKRINNIAVFSGIEAIQEVNMIPISPLKDAIFPRGNLEATVRENEYL